MVTIIMTLFNENISNCIAAPSRTTQSTVSSVTKAIFVAHSLVPHTIDAIQTMIVVCHFCQMFLVCQHKDSVKSILLGNSNMRLRKSCSHSKSFCHVALWLPSRRGCVPRTGGPNCRRCERDRVCVWLQGRRDADNKQSERNANIGQRQRMGILFSLFLAAENMEKKILAQKRKQRWIV